MYRLNYNHTPEKWLYIFRVDANGVPIYSSYSWTDITGMDEALVLLHDPVEENDVFTPIIKTSLQVRLLRRNIEGEIQMYQDIIESDDNEWMAVVVENGQLEFNSASTESLPTIYLTSGATLIFKGLLTLETYGEKYERYAEVNLTFHDRLGILAEEDFQANKSKMRLTEILGECLCNTICAKHLFIEFPYDIDINSVEEFSGSWSGLKTPRKLLQDISEFHLEPKQDLIVEILNYYGYRLYNDFSVNVYGADTPDLADCGVIRMEIVVDTRKAETEYLQFTLEQYVEPDVPQLTFSRYTESETSSAFEQVPTTEERVVIQLDTENHPIMQRSGSWQLIRKAKEIIAKNEFNLRDNLLFPDDFKLEDFIYNTESSTDKYNLRYLFWGFWYPISTWRTTLKEYIENPQSLRRAYGNSLPNNVLGVMVKDDTDYDIDPRGIPITNIVNMVKHAGTTLKVEVAATSNQANTNLYTSLLILHKRDIYTYNYGSWNKNPELLPYGLRIENFSGDTSQTFDDIPLPSGIPAGDSYILLATLDAGNVEWTAGKVCYVTSLKITMNAAKAYPRKLELTTILSDTRRSAVKIEPKFYNLPDIEGCSALYDNGTYAVEVDEEVGGEIIPANSGIIPLTKMVFNGNNGTMLAHLSDMYGVQHEFDRWEFNADVAKAVIADKYTLTLETEGSSLIYASPVKERYAVGDVVTLTATTDLELLKWVVNGQEILLDESGYFATLDIVIEEDTTVKIVAGTTKFWEDFVDWEGVYPDQTPVGWVKTVYYAWNTYEVSETIHVKPYENGVHFYKYDTKGLKLVKTLASNKKLSGRCIIDLQMDAFWTDGQGPFAFWAFVEGATSPAYIQKFYEPCDAPFEMDFTETIDRIGLAIYADGAGWGYITQPKVKSIKIMKIE